MSLHSITLFSAFSTAKVDSTAHYSIDTDEYQLPTLATGMNADCYNGNLELGKYKTLEQLLLFIVNSGDAVHNEIHHKNRTMAIE